jgi:hypothetical protein
LKRGEYQDRDDGDIAGSQNGMLAKPHRHCDFIVSPQARLCARRVGRENTMLTVWCWAGGISTIRLFMVSAAPHGAGAALTRVPGLPPGNY